LLQITCSRRQFGKHHGILLDEELVLNGFLIADHDVLLKILLGDPQSNSAKKFAPRVLISEVGVD
jgi:hypothetical protein